jgi:hypothetical protein
MVCMIQGLWSMCIFLVSSSHNDLKRVAENLSYSQLSVFIWNILSNFCVIQNKWQHVLNAMI